MAQEDLLSLESWALSRFLALPLFVLLVRADHADDAAAAYDLALVTDPFDRRSNFHATLSILRLRALTIPCRYGVTSP